MMSRPIPVLVLPNFDPPLRLAVASDLEKQALEKQQVQQNVTRPVEHPRISTVRDGDFKRASIAKDPIHSHTSDDQGAQRSKNHSSSIRSRGLPVVPLSERRGLLARFALIPEVERPYDYERSTKWTITLMVAAAAAAAPMGSSILYPALSDIAKDLQTTSTVANLSIALYMLSMGIFPLWWSSFSETLGRRTIYIVSFTFFTFFNILTAFSTSISILVALRILGGGAAASVQAVGAGTIADIWETRERGHAMGIFYLGPLMAPLVAPIVGGGLAQAWGWRSTQWFLIVYGAILLVTLTLFLPETLVTKPDPILVPTTDDKETRSRLSRISTTQSVQRKTKSAAAIFKRFFLDPLSILQYLRFPAVVSTVYLASITFGSLYMLNISLEVTFSKAPYNFTSIIVGLLYVPAALGYVIASVFGGRWNDAIMHRRARAAERYDEQGRLVLRPEDRLGENAWIAAAIFPGALVWYGWTAEAGVYWLAPVVANFFFGLGSMIIFGTSTTMLTEFMPRKSSSGVAINNLVRNVVACICLVVAQPLISAIGNGWLFLGLSVICWISAFSVIGAMKRFGPSWRKEMDEKMRAM